MKKLIVYMLLLSFLSILMSAASYPQQKTTPPTIELKILQTTDLHGSMLSYDYKKQKPTVEFGLTRTAAFIRQIRSEAENTLLFDTGDILEGNELDEYAYESRPFSFTKIHPVYKAMNTLMYDAATLGNHEFNYGIPFLMQSIKGANFPYVNANIYLKDNNENDYDDLNFFKPYLILDKKMRDTNGGTHNIKVGVIGFITPIVAEWNKEYFKGNLQVKNIKETAEKFIPELKKEGADIIIALAHVGIEADKGLQEKSGNSVLSLSKVKGIDAILYGHSHSLFPVKERLQARKEINSVNGTINDIISVQAGYWGNHLGLIDMKLHLDKGKWKIKSSKSNVKPIYRTVNNRKKPLGKQDPYIIEKILKDHKETLEYLKNKD